MKKEIIAIILVGVLFFSGFGVVAADDDVEIKEESIVISEPIIKEVENYVTVNLDEATSFLSDAGRPMLPIVTRVFILPFGSKIHSVTVSFSEEYEMMLPKEVQPASELTPLTTAVHDSTGFVKDTTIYESSELYPSDSYSYTSGAGLNDEEHVIYLAVHCYPVRYSPANNMIYYSKNIDIRIVYEKPTTSMVFGDEYDLIIISPSKFSNVLQPLVDHKNSYNVRTLLKTTEEILGHYQGRDDPEQVKYFIKEAIETWNAKYVLLIGDMDLMPMRISAIDMWEDEGIPTDLYYADIYDENGSFCSWDTDNDNKFGEYDWREGDIDKVDLYADIKVGRIPCKNSLGLKIAVGKIITYETQTYGTDWYKNAVLMGGDTFPGHGPYEGEVVTEAVSQQITEFNSIKLWTSTGNYNPRNINQKITEGAGFVSYSGHGYEFGFGTSPPNDEDRIEYYTPYTLGMLNIKKYPVIFFDACSTARIDYKVFGIKIPCFAWYLVKKPVGGAVATIGSTRVAFTNVNNEGIHGGAGFMNLHFFKAYEPGVMVSEMLVSAQNDYLNEDEWKDCITLEEFILVGDPSLKIGGYPPSQEFNVKISGNDLNGYLNVPLQFQASTSKGQQPYTYSWDLDEDGAYDDATGENIEWTWTETGNYWISVKATDSNNKEKTYKTIINIEPKSNKPSGPTSGVQGVKYTFTAKATDNPYWNEIYYYFDWGDGTFSDIMGPYSPNELVEATHSWSNSKTYQIRVKSLLTNSEGSISEETGWSDPLHVSMSKSKTKNYQQHPFLQKFLERLYELQIFKLLFKNFSCWM